METKLTFNGEALSVARRSRGISQKALAASINITPATLCKIELGHLAIKEELLSKIAEELHYPNTFFFKEINILTPNIIYYRKRTALRAGDVEKVDNIVHIERFRIKQLLKALELKQKIEPMNPADFGSPEEIARRTRHILSVPAGPIKNLVNIIEGAGIIIITTDFNSDKLDGMIVPDQDALPLIYLNKDAPGDRQRSTLAHELGHWIMHHAFNPMADEDVEDEAFRFAGEFMVPSMEFQRMVNDKTTLSGYADLKRYWKMSMQFLIKRAYQLQIITKERYTSLFQQMSKMGYRKREPSSLDIPTERPILIENMIKAHLHDLEFSPEELQEHIGMLTSEIHSLLNKGKGTAFMKIA
ncbi:helix-turn-helix domain-containing protein [Hymenobacter actinosclerus]|nr:XRE family transcriptional regulator [Hymenobacter actinosclerus]